jgi:hypothetical protein
MAVKEFEKPELKDYSPIPKLVEEATSHLAPFKSKEEFQKSLGYPGELVDNWQDIALNKMGDLLKNIDLFVFTWIHASNVELVQISVITILEQKIQTICLLADKI